MKISKKFLNKAHEVNICTGKFMKVQFFWNIILCCWDKFFLLCTLMFCSSRLHVDHCVGADKSAKLGQSIFSCIIPPVVVYNIKLTFIMLQSY